MLGPYLGADTRIILDGQASWTFKDVTPRGYEAHNLPTVKGPAAEAFIDAYVAKYLAAGVLEYCPPGKRPLCVSPMGCVPKKTDPFLRLVTDLRGANLFKDDWPMTMLTLAAAAFIFCSGAYCWSRDVEAAYLICGLGGCSGGLKHRKSIGGVDIWYMGCTPDDCLGFCSKALLGIKWRGQYLRYASCPFGAKQSGNILNVLLMPYLRRLRDKGIHLLVWVDDLLMCLPPLPEHRHDAALCGGHETCKMCQCTRDRALKLEAEIDREMDALGLFTNEKRQAPARQGEFIGLDYDTADCVFLLTKDKTAALAQKAKMLAEAEDSSPRLLAKFRGKVVWYSPCIQGVSILTRHLNVAIGAFTSDAEWDRRSTTPGAARSELQWLADNLRNMAAKARPMWELTGEQAVRAFKTGQRAVDAMLITDASVHGWGAVLQVRDNGIVHEWKTTGRWHHHNDLEQAHREAQATPRAFRAFRHLLTGRSVVHVSDCACVVRAQQVGSAKSSRLQEAALEVWHIVHDEGAWMTSAWMSGIDMMTSGVDYLSREGAYDLDAASLTADAWAEAQQVAQQQGMRLAVDWFADDTLHTLPAFWSRDACGEAEGIDALQATSWRECTCTTCGKLHERASWLFPPTPLLGRAVAKAAKDEAFGMAAIPYMPGAVWWPVIKAASVHTYTLGTGQIILGPQTDRGVYAREGWRIVVFDFRNPNAVCSSETRCHCLTPSPQVAREWKHGEHSHRELARAQALLASEWRSNDTHEREEQNEGRAGRQPATLRTDVQ